MVSSLTLIPGQLELPSNPPEQPVRMIANTRMPRYLGMLFLRFVSVVMNLLRYRIVSSRMEGLAFQNALESHPSPPKQSIFENRLVAIMRTGWVKATSGLGEHPGKCHLVESQQCQRDEAREIRQTYWHISQCWLRMLMCIFTMYRHHSNQVCPLVSASRQWIFEFEAFWPRLLVNEQSK